MVSNLWKAFFCATIGVIMFKFLEKLQAVEMFYHTAYEPILLDHEVIFFTILGILSGLLGALFINVFTRVIFLRAKLKLPFISERWRYCFFISLVVGLISFPVSFMQLPDKKILNAMFNVTDLDKQSSK